MKKYFRGICLSMVRSDVYGKLFKQLFRRSRLVRIDFFTFVFSAFAETKYIICIIYCQVRGRLLIIKG